MARRKGYTPRPRASAHRVTTIPGVRLTLDQGGLCPLQLELEHCRCGAWRARIVRGTRSLYTDWSEPCAAPSPAPARDDA